MGYIFRLARNLLYTPSHTISLTGNTYHSLCYTSHGALVGMRNSLMTDRSHEPLHHKQTLYHKATSCSHYGKKKELFYLTTHSTHFIYGYMVLNLPWDWLCERDWSQSDHTATRCLLHWVSAASPIYSSRDLDFLFQNNLRSVKVKPKRTEEGNVLFNNTLNTFYLQNEPLR